VIQPIRPNDATGVYQRNVDSADAANAGSRPNGGTAGAGQSHRVDQVTISEQAQQLRRVLDAAVSASDVREDRVEFIRRQLDAGTYTVDVGAIATRLVDEGLFE
jgi:negative regulator of flagellin synthesis FlgM